MKVFLDIGAHDGETLHAVRDPKYGFDRIYCLEPASSCWPALEAVADERVTVCKYGLWDRTCERLLYNLALEARACSRTNSERRRRGSSADS